MSETMIAAGPDLDAAIARRIFGFWLDRHPNGLMNGEEHWWGEHSVTAGAWVYASVALPVQLYGSSYRYSDGLPKFSTDNDAAMAIVAAFALRHVNVSLYTDHVGNWYCFFGPTPTFDHLHPFKPRHETRARSMPEAICRAALLAIDLAVVPWVTPRRPAPADQEAP